MMFESVLARNEPHHAAFGMNVFTVALEAAIRAVRIDRRMVKNSICLNPMVAG
jgi:hypothetical protein